MPSATQVTPPTSITATQQEKLQTLLSDFDVDNLSVDDATSIMAGIEEIGIAPSESLVDLMAENGFDAKTIGDMGGADHPPPPPSTVTENTSELVSFLEELLESYDSDDLSEENKDSILAAVQEEFGLVESDSLLSIEV